LLQTQEATKEGGVYEVCLVLHRDGRFQEDYPFPARPTRLHPCVSDATSVPRRAKGRRRGCNWTSDAYPSVRASPNLRQAARLGAEPELRRAGNLGGGIGSHTCQRLERIPRSETERAHVSGDARARPGNGAMRARSRGWAAG